MFVCNNCWNESIKWAWQCGFCKEWNTLVEFKEQKINSKDLKWVKKQLQKLDENSEILAQKTPTKSNELNNLLWGWLTTWSVILLSWEPGIWKSTLSLQLANWYDWEIIYVSWEETQNQISDRAKRLWITWKNISILSENNLENILETLSWIKTNLIIIDSISVITSSNANSWAWSISQVKEVAEKLVNYAKSTNTTIIIIGHITKDWNLAWPKTLEHLVDTVLFFEGERYEDIRLLRSLKNRFWSTWEVAIFKMTENWLKDLVNPGLEFISSENDNKTIGSSLSITLEWNRPIVVEIESLTTYTKFGYPKRSARWIATPKLDLILAVLWKYSKLWLESYDVYANIVRWIKVWEPWIDLSITSSIISSKLNKPIPRDSIFIWEVSLTWRVKNVFWIEKRIKEAIKLWFKNIYIPNIDLKIDENVNLIKIIDIATLVNKISWN